MADDKVRWVKKDSFVMPILPKSLKVDPVLAGLLHLAAFLELSGENTVAVDLGGRGDGACRVLPSPTPRQSD